MLLSPQILARTRPPAVAATYTGPGDIVASATAWWGLRAYTTASIGSNVIKLCRSSDSATQNFVCLATGALDVASINTFKGADTLTVDTLYDQTGNGNHLNLWAGTPSNQPNFLLTGGPNNGLRFTFDGSRYFGFTGFGGITQVQPWTITSFAIRTANFTTAQFIMGQSSAYIMYDALSAAFKFHATADVGATCIDNAWQTFICVGNGASGDISIDGVSTAVNAGTQDFGGTDFEIGNKLAAPLDNGSWVEGGIWAGSFSAGNKTSMNSNAHTFWGA